MAQHTLSKEISQPEVQCNQNTFPKQAAVHHVQPSIYQAHDGGYFVQEHLKCNALDGSQLDRFIISDQVCILKMIIIGLNFIRYNV